MSTSDRQYSMISFVALLIEVMLKVTFLKLVHTNVLGNDYKGIWRKFKLSMNLMVSLGISINIILAPLYMQYSLMP